MQTIIRLFLCLLINPAFAAADNSIELDGVSLYELSKLAFNEVCNLDFSADADFVNDPKKISFFARDRSPENIKNLVFNVIEKNGYFISQDKKFLYISHTKKEEKPDVYIHYPKNRSAESLVELVRPIFQNNLISSVRSVPDPSGQSHAEGAPDTSALGQIDKKSPAIVFNGLPADVERFKGLMASLDIPDSQVEIKAFLYEVKVSKVDQTGLNLVFSLLSGKLGLDLGSKLTTNLIKLNFDNLTAALNLFSSDNRFNLVSSPHLLVSNNERASFNVGQDVPILGQFSQNVNGQIVQSVQYKQSGVIFDVSPRILENTVDLTIHHQISSFINTTTGLNNTPTLNKRELSTVIKSKHEDVLILGGLNEKTSNDSKSGFKFLPSLFKNSSFEGSESEILLILSVKKL